MTETPEDLALHRDAIRKSRSGDTSAFAVIVRAYQSYAFALAIRLLYDEHEAEDVVQESFVRVWTHLPRYDEGVAFTTWLYTIVTNLCLDRLRARRRRQRFFSPIESTGDAEECRSFGPDTFQFHSNRDLVEKVRLLTQRLTINQRLVFTLRDLQELSISETVLVTGMSPASVKTHLSAARRRLREFIQRQYDVEDLA